MIEQTCRDWTAILVLPKENQKTDGSVFTFSSERGICSKVDAGVAEMDSLQMKKHGHSNEAIISAVEFVKICSRLRTCDSGSRS